MTGDQDDIVGRLRLTLPGRWFADSAPILDGLLAGLSVVWTGLFSLLQLVRTQSRIGTATNGYLDVASKDFFGDTLPRKSGESDDAFRARIQAAMHRERATRAGVVAAAAEAGFSAQVFEPAQPRDTGAYSTPGVLAWNVGGGWGSLEMPLQFLITVTPGPGADNTALPTALTRALPAGGAAWVRITG